MEKTNFNEMNFSPVLMRAIDKIGLTQPTDVQEGVIPAMMNWQDVIAKAPTGTGKTFAFGIPIIEQVDVTNRQIQAIILCPTRELSLQISVELKRLAEFKHGLKVVSIYGGQPIDRQIMALKRGPQVIVATPGRLVDHLNRRTIDLTGVQTAVLDEADRMLDMGFVQEVTKILDLMPQRKNLALLSATISREVMDVAWTYQRDSVEITVKEDKENKPVILQYSLDTSRSNKMDSIFKIIDSERYERIMVFCNTKNMVKRLTEAFLKKGYSADCIHGDIRQSAREKVMGAFRKGGLKILVATDVAARGIDVDDVEAVFNYDIPDENEYYVHRIGRTGRAKKHGISFTFVSYYDIPRLKEIMRFTKAQIMPMSFDKNSKPSFPVPIAQAVNS